MKKDISLVAIIGGAVGLLIQPVLTNIGAIVALQGKFGISDLTLRFLVFLFFLVLAPIALIIASYIGRFIPVLYQFAKFAAVGTLNSFINLGIYNLLILFSGQQPADLSRGLIFVFISIAFLFATTNSYLWNKFWTFQDKTSSRSQTVVAFYIFTAITYALNVGIVTLISKTPILGISENVWVSLVSPIVGIIVVLFVNFVGYKYFIFKGGSKTEIAK